MADHRIDGSKIAFVVANEGIEEVELTDPWHAVTWRAGLLCCWRRTGHGPGPGPSRPAGIYVVDIAVRR